MTCGSTALAQSISSPAGFVQIAKGAAASGEVLARFQEVADMRHTLSTGRLRREPLWQRAPGMAG